MEHLEKIMLEMEEALDNLIIIAENLKGLSEQVVSQEQLAPLQQRQEIFLSHLKELDAAYKKAERIEHPSLHLINQRLGTKVKTFQGLNKAFIENLKMSPGSQDFEKNKRTEHFT